MKCCVIFLGSRSKGRFFGLGASEMSSSCASSRSHCSSSPSSSERSPCCSAPFFSHPAYSAPFVLAFFVGRWRLCIKLFALSSLGFPVSLLLLTVVDAFRCQNQHRQRCLRPQNRGL